MREKKNFHLLGPSRFRTSADDILEEINKMYQIENFTISGEKFFFSFTAAYLLDLCFEFFDTNMKVRIF